jgi:hypothetical protein
MEHVLSKGTYYSPAWKHYTDSANRIVVICDRCNTSDLSCCIGYGNLDLCMACMAQLTAPSQDSWIVGAARLLLAQAGFGAVPVSGPVAPAALGPGFDRNRVLSFLSSRIGEDYEDTREELASIGFVLHRRYDNDECDRGVMPNTVLVSWITGEILEILA